MSTKRLLSQWRREGRTDLFRSGLGIASSTVTLHAVLGHATTLVCMSETRETISKKELSHCEQPEVYISEHRDRLGNRTPITL